MSMSIENRRTRAILPRSVVNEDPVLLPTEASSNSAASRPGTFSSSRTNIRSACIACRRRRSRCTGGNPCSRCRALETDCIYNESQDGRTRALREKGKEELDLHKKVIKGVFRAVREGNEQGLLELIRTDATLEVIANAIDEANIDTRSESSSKTPEYSPSLSSHHQLDGGPPNHSKFYRQGTYEVMQQDLTHTIAQPLSNRSTVAEMDQLLMHGNLFQGPLTHSTGNIIGIHEMHPLHQRDTSELQRLSSLYINFRDAVKQMIDQGVPASTILAGPAVSCSMLYRAQQGPFGVSAWAFAIVNSISGVDILFRLAWLCYITRFMRWTVVSSQENFSLMPVAMMPTTTQLAVPHAAVIDLIPIPALRDQMIHNFRDFTMALELAGATVHWTESIEDAIDQDPLTGEMTVSARFESHIANMDNFCFGRSLLDTFPELEGQVQIAEQDQIVSVSSGTSPIPSPINTRSTL